MLRHGLKNPVSPSSSPGPPDAPVDPADPVEIFETSPITGHFTLDIFGFQRKNKFILDILTLYSRFSAEIFILPEGLLFRHRFVSTPRQTPGAAGAIAGEAKI